MNKFFLRVSLAFLIAVSFYLSFFIWTNNGNYNSNALISNRSLTQVDHSRYLTNLYSPVKIFSVDLDGNKYLLPEQINAINQEVKKSFKHLDFKGMSSSTVENYKQYENIINNNDSLQLYYQSPLSIKALSDIFGFKINKKYSEVPVNRLIIERISPLESDIYLTNDQNKTYYNVNVAFYSDKIFNLANRSKNKIEVSERKTKDGYITFFEKPLPLNSYTYLIKTLDDSYYVSSFMTNDGSAGLTFDSKTNTYKKGLTKSLSINDETGTVHFVDHHLDENTVPRNLTKLLTYSRQVMEKIGNSFNSFRYFSNPQKNRVVFRSYVEGFPVFFNEKSGDVSLSWGKNSQSLYFLNSTLEVPISTSQNKLVLESTNTLIEKLNQQGIATSSIQDIQVGYSWIKNHDSTEVVNLLPQYFVKINGVYKEASTLINRKTGGK